MSTIGAELSFYDKKEINPEFDYVRAADLILNHESFAVALVKRLLPKQPAWNIKVALEAVLKFPDFHITGCDGKQITEVQPSYNGSLSQKLKVGDVVWHTNYNVELTILEFGKELTGKFRKKENVTAQGNEMINLVRCEGGLYELKDLRRLDSQPNELVPTEIKIGDKTYELVLKETK